MSWIEAHDRGKATVEMLLRKFQEMAVLLEIPSGAEVWKAGGDAWKNGYQALKSILYFLLLVGRPFVLAIGWTLFTAGSLIWEHVLVNGIYKHGLSQSREAAVSFYKFQTSLSQKELMIEAVICAVIVALFFLRRWLQRNRYIQRASLVAKRQMRKASRVYHSTVKRIATVSLGLAAMMPHALFGGCAVALSLVFPRVVAVIACEGVISILSFLYPIVCTVTLLHEYSQDEKKKLNEEDSAKSDKENNEPSSPKRAPKKTESKPNKTPLTEQRKRRSPRHLQPTASSRAKEYKSPTTTGYFPRTKPPTERKKRRVSAASMISVVTMAENTLEEELDYWLRFWMVRSAVLSVKTLFGFFFIPYSVTLMLRNLEFFFYVWLYALPLIIPQSIGGQRLPEARPLRVLVSYLSPAARYMYDHVANLVPETLWRNTIVATVSRFFDLAVLLRLVSREFVDWLLHVLEESRPLLLPSGTLLMPGVITQYASLYVQYCPMIARSTEGEKSEVCLKYWVLNAMIGSLLQYFSGILWWVPFSSHFTYLLWCYLCLPRTITTWYGEFHHELCSWGLMPGSNQSEDLTQTRLGQTALSVLEILPKADPASPSPPSGDPNTSNRDDAPGIAAAAAPVVTGLSAEEHDNGLNANTRAKTKESKPLVLLDSSDDEDDVYIPPFDEVVEKPKTSSSRSTRQRRRTG